MTGREHFESWMRHSRPNMPLDYDEQEGYYYHDIVHLMFAAWNERGQHRPTENSKITKEQLSMDHPETLVDRLNGIYQDAVYPVSPLQREAAREISRLRKELTQSAMDEADLIHDNSSLYASLQGETTARVAAEKEVERLSEESADARVIITELRVMIQHSLTVDKDTPLWEMTKPFLRKYINKKPAEAG